jgi:uncharacterized repeat protein (TIGR01451 family)/CSLREA domain-containing protein
MLKCSKQAVLNRFLSFAVTGILFLASQSLMAFTFDVDSFTDAVDDNPGDGFCHTAANNCTLRAAIQEANAWQGPDIIRLGIGTYTLSIAGRNENAAATGDLDISDSVKIYGVDKSLTVVDGGGVDRVFDVVATSAAVTLANLTVRNGLITDPGDACAASYVTEPGGGVRNSGSLTISDSNIQNNNHKCSGGGGIANESGDVTLNYDIVQGNQANAGAGINQNFGFLAVNHSLIFNNTAVGAGGGIHAFNGITQITDSIIDSNKGPLGQNGLGGGLDNEGSSAMTVTGSTVSRNQSGLGGGVNNCCGTGTVTLINSTITGNEALRGGGINTEYSIEIINSTITNNQADGLLITPTSTTPQYGAGLYYKSGTAKLKNNIISDNNKVGGGSNNCELVTPALLSEGYNIDKDGTCQLNATGDLKTDPNLAAIPFVNNQIPKTNNGGPTPTHYLNSMSPAIDGGNPAGCTDQDGNTLTTDQRGFTRPVNGGSGTARCDVGPVEVQSGANLADLEVRVTGSPNPVDPGGTVSYVVNVTNDGPSTATGVTVTDTLPANTTFNGTSSTVGCGAVGNVVTCTVPTSMNAGDTVQVTIAADVAPNATGTLTNTVTVGGNQTDPNSVNNSQSLAITVNLQADLSITMSDSPDPAVLNSDKVTYTLVVTSNSGSPVSNVVVTDNLPSNASLVGGSSSTNRGTCTESPGTQRVICSLGSMSSGNTATISFKVTPAAKGTITNTATVNFDGRDTDPSDNKVSATTTIQIQSDIALTITDIPDPVLLNNDLTYIINVINNGPSPSSDVTLTATLPGTATFNPPASTSRGSCTQTAANTISCDLQAMTKGAQATVTIFVAPTSVGTIQFSASAQVPSDETDPVSGNNSATESTDVQANPTGASADLSITLAGSPNPVAVNGTLTYTMSVANSGPDDATGLIAALSLPASVNIASSSSGCTKDALTVVVRCAFSSLSNGANAQATVTVTPTQSGIINATASVGFVGTDPNKVNNTATKSITVSGSASNGGGSGGGGGGGIVNPLLLLGMLVLYSGVLLLRRRRADRRL